MSDTMRVLSVELDDDTVDALESERELFGFENRSAYVRWIVENRGSIDQGSDHGKLLADHGERIADHGERIARLERRVAALAPDTERATDGTGATTEDGAAESDSPSPEAAESPGEPAPVPDAPSDRPAESESETDRVRTTDGGTAGAARTARPRESGSDHPSESVTSMNLTPERVARIPEDRVMEDAGELGSVESERLDELSRRAVAKTRERLNRDVQTGLEYASSTGLSDAGVLPGEDVVDLESLEVPGRSEERVEKRRRAAGRAVAYLKDEDRARKADFVDALFEECPAEYDTPDGWWRCIKEALRQVDAVEGGDGSRVWRFDA